MLNFEALRVFLDESMTIWIKKDIFLYDLIPYAFSVVLGRTWIGGHDFGARLWNGTCSNKRAFKFPTSAFIVFVCS
jgi:hypothetical protein